VAVRAHRCACRRRVGGRACARTVRPRRNAPMDHCTRALNCLFTDGRPHVLPREPPAASTWLGRSRLYKILLIINRYYLQAYNKKRYRPR